MQWKPRDLFHFVKTVPPPPQIWSVRIGMSGFLSLLPMLPTFSLCDRPLDNSKRNRDSPSGLFENQGYHIHFCWAFNCGAARGRIYILNIIWHLCCSGTTRCKEGGRRRAESLLKKDQIFRRLSTRSFHNWDWTADADAAISCVTDAWLQQQQQQTLFIHFAENSSLDSLQNANESRHSRRS